MRFSSEFLRRRLIPELPISPKGRFTPNLVGSYEGKIGKNKGKLGYYKVLNMRGKFCVRGNRENWVIIKY